MLFLRQDPSAPFARKGFAGEGEELIFKSQLLLLLLTQPPLLIIDHGHFQCVRFLLMTRKVQFGDARLHSAFHHVHDAKALFAWQRFLLLCFGFQAHVLVLQFGLLFLLARCLLEGGWWFVEYYDRLTLSISV